MITHSSHSDYKESVIIYILATVCSAYNKWIHVRKELLILNENTIIILNNVSLDKQQFIHYFNYSHSVIVVS